MWVCFKGKRIVVLMMGDKVFLSGWTFFGQEIFSLDKFWFRGSTQNTFKPLVWHLLHQNILIITDFMNVYEKLIIFKKSLIFNIFWWKKCQTIGLKVFWVDPRNQNLSKLNISCPKIFESDKKTCQKVIKLCFPFSKLCFSSSKLCLRQDVATGEVQNIMWICRHLTQSFTTREIWSGTSLVQLTVHVKTIQSCISFLSLFNTCKNARKSMQRTKRVCEPREL